MRVTGAACAPSGGRTPYPLEAGLHTGTGCRLHCWDPTVFLGEKRIKNGDILVFVVHIEKSYRTICHFSSYTIKTKIDPFSMHFSSWTIRDSQSWKFKFDSSLIQRVILEWFWPQNHSWIKLESNMNHTQLWPPRFFTNSLLIFVGFSAHNSVTNLGYQGVE